ncbi:MAG: CHAT domain-containing protein, partial [Bacteroidia bacterium]
MKGKPVIFLAFANDQDAHLDLLKQEARGIYRALQDRHDAGHLEIYREESADIDDIFHNFNRFRDRVNIFHYGGHANGTQLRLEDQDANATGLAQLLGSQSQLQLVVLNGCSTRKQVIQLLKAGVKAVIATSVPVQDAMAMDFGIQFYQTLVSGASIQQSFTQAKALLETKYGDDKGIAIFRSLIWEEESNPDAVMPWGLYVDEKEESPAVLNWKLPDFKKVSLPASFGESIGQNYKVNQYIVGVLEAMAQYNKKLYGEMEDEFGDPRDPREYPEVIIKNFPWPIGAQLRILVANAEMMNRPGMPRLKQLVYTYVVTSQFMCYILLAQLWDAKIEGKLDLDDEFMKAFTLLPETSNAFDFVKLINKIRQLFQTAKLTPFIDEYSVLFESLEKKDETYEAYQFLESVRTRINTEDVSSEEMEQICNETEFCLTAFLKGVAFMAKYRLVTIKDINIFKPKHRDALFRMNIGVLNAFDKEFLRSREKDQNIYTDSHSVLVVKNLKEMDDFLNLSPFIIDKNAFSGKPI